MSVVLHDYWRSSAAYRVRIALNLKRIAYTTRPVSLIEGEQRGDANLAVNPQGLVPTLEIDGLVLTQSLAIVNYLDATRPDPPMVPRDPAARSRVLAMALVVAADIHPINNLRVLRHLKNEMGQAQDAIDDWYRHWVREGLTALEAMATDAGAFLGGETPGIADLCLVPQLYNARRFELDLAPFPTLLRIDQACRALDPFARAAPEAVKPN